MFRLKAVLHRLWTRMVPACRCGFVPKLVRDGLPICFDSSRGRYLVNLRDHAGDSGFFAISYCPACGGKLFTDDSDLVEGQMPRSERVRLRRLTSKIRRSGDALRILGPPESRGVEDAPDSCGAVTRVGDTPKRNVLRYTTLSESMDVVVVEDPSAGATVRLQCKPGPPTRPAEA